MLISIWHSTYYIEVCCYLCLQEHTPKNYVFIRDTTTFLEYNNHFRLNSQHKWEGGGGVYDHLMSTKIFTLILRKIIIITLKLWGKRAQSWYGFGNHLIPMICLCPTRSGLSYLGKNKVAISDPSTLVLKRMNMYPCNIWLVHWYFAW